MAAAAEHYREEWSAARASLPGAGLEWLERARREALERFCERGFPTPREEDWKYTNVRAIERRAFRIVPAEGDGDTDAAAGATARAATSEERAGSPASALASALAARRIADLGPAATLVFVNGRFAPALSRIPDGLPDGVRIESLARVLADEPALVQPHLAAASASAAPAEPDAFAALNRAFFTGGAVVSVPPEVRLERPVELVFVAEGDAGADTAGHPLVLVLAGARARAAVVEHYLAAGEGAKLSNPATRIEVGEGAEVGHFLLLEEDDSTWHTGRIEARVAAGGRLASNAVHLDGRLVRYGIEASLEGDGAGAALNGLYVAHGRRHVDFHTRVDHREPGGWSDQVYKGLLDGRGRGVFNGRVLVHRGAQGSDAHQSNHNLLLSEDAEADTKPQLEIFADDVKCSHGATVGQLDEGAVHYVRSRGLPEAAARALLTFGFAEDVLERMGAPALRRHVERGLVSALPALADLPALDAGAADGPAGAGER